MSAIACVDGIDPDAMDADDREPRGRLHRGSTEPGVAGDDGDRGTDLPHDRGHIRRRREAHLDVRGAQAVEADAVDRLDDEAVGHRIVISR
jgi:hypothetical protein